MEARHVHGKPAKGDVQATAMRYVWAEVFRVWGSFALFALSTFMVFSSGDLSFFLTLSSLLSTFSFLMVTVKITMGRTVKGVSLRMMECYILIFLGRLISWYRPVDRSGRLYQLSEAVGFCLAGAIVFLCRGRYASTYDPTMDTFNHVFLILPTVALAVVSNPTRNLFIPDILWAFALYLESVVVLCQLFMFTNEGKAQPHTSHFLMAQALSKLTSFVYWASFFRYRSDPNHYINWVVALHLVQLCIMGDFIHRYIRCMRKGISVSQIVCSDAV